MTLFRLHDDDTRHSARESSFLILRAFGRIGAAFRLLHRAIVTAKLRRLQNEMLFRRNYDEMFSPEEDATRFPQRPLILGDKWDF